MEGKSNVKRGDVWAVDLEPTEGAEMKKRRPCAVVSNNTANKYSPLVTVAVISTTAPRKSYPFIVEIPGSAKMPERSWIHCNQIRTVDKEGRFGRYYTSLDTDTMRKVDRALRVQLALDTTERQTVDE
jgi:mRNA interferase MazF